jgi:hypothetical protein
METLIKMRSSLVPFYYYTENSNYVENKIKADHEDTEATVSSSIWQLSTCNANELCETGKIRGQLHKDIITSRRKAPTAKTGVVINLDNIAKKNVETLLNEISYTDHLQCELDYGNKNVFKNFKLFLIMEPK